MVQKKFAEHYLPEAEVTVVIQARRKLFKLIWWKRRFALIYGKSSEAMSTCPAVPDCIARGYDPGMVREVGATLNVYSPPVRGLETSSAFCLNVIELHVGSMDFRRRCGFCGWQARPLFPVRTLIFGLREAPNSFRRTRSPDLRLLPDD